MKNWYRIEFFTDEFMTLYHLQCISPFLILCAIGAGAFIYGFLKGWWTL